MTTPAWSPPEDAAIPADGWKNNAIALAARTLLYWALGALVAGWLVSTVSRIMPIPGVQTLGTLALALGLIACIVLPIIAIVFAAIGLYRASRLGGYRRGIALSALFGSIALLVLAYPLTAAVSAFTQFR